MEILSKCKSDYIRFCETRDLMSNEFEANVQCISCNTPGHDLLSKYYLNLYPL